VLSTHAYEIGLAVATIALMITAIIALLFRGGSAKDYAKPIALSDTERSVLLTTIEMKRRHKAGVALAARPETEKMRRRAARIARESDTVVETVSIASQSPSNNGLPAPPL